MASYLGVIMLSPLWLPPLLLGDNGMLGQSKHDAIKICFLYEGHEL